MIEKIKQNYKKEGLIKTIKFVFNKGMSKLRQKINMYKTINSKKGNKKIKNRINKRVFIFASAPYFDIGGGQRSAQLANAFSKKNYDVFYFYCIPTNESKIFNLDYPTVIHRYIKKITKKEYEKFVSSEDIVLFEIPTKEFLPFLDISYNKKMKIVYENIDNWETSLGKQFYNEEILKKFLEKSTILTATSKNLKEQLHDYLKKFKINNKEVLYSANAVNDKLFSLDMKYERPEDMFIGSKTFLYYGSLWGSWFDWDLIISLAKINKNYQINLIGDESPISHKLKNFPSNIHFLGLKKQLELPSYLSFCDYTLLPFKSDSIGNYVSPLKIFEYIQMNTIVLATTLPDIKDYPNTYFGNKIEDWIKIIKENPKVNIKEKEKFIEKNNWDYRCYEIVKKLKEVNK